MKEHFHPIKEFHGKRLDPDYEKWLAKVRKTEPVKRPVFTIKKKV